MGTPRCLDAGTDRELAAQVNQEGRRHIANGLAIFNFDLGRSEAAVGKAQEGKGITTLGWEYSCFLFIHQSFE